MSKKCAFTISSQNCFFVFLVMSLLFSVPGALAENVEEMSLLEMYFSEDELAISPTRTLKPLSQVAENISIVTAAEIESMNAHSVGEVLDKITGLFLDFQGHDFLSGDMLKIQASEVRHVLVLLDNMPYNIMEDGKPTTISIPVMIIKKIEIIKGPASSVWGSSLGGVINIITKDTGYSKMPSGTVSASYGESSSQDYRAEARGGAGRAGYYLYAGRQKSDGLRANRFFENNAFYSKLRLRINPVSNLMITAGYSEPEMNFGDITIYRNILVNKRTVSATDVFFATALFDSHITRRIDFETSVHIFHHDFQLISRNIKTDDLASSFGYDNEIAGMSAKLTWKKNNHNAVLGIDVSDGVLEQTSLTSMDPEKSTIRKVAVFVNDTISLGDLAVTPGIRYDDDDITDHFISPSIGLTCIFSGDTLLRANVSRGFTSPPAAFISGGGFSLEPNPDLKPENVWSYQAGLETNVKKHVKARVNVFYHDADNFLEKEPIDPESGRKIYVNKGRVTREGAELELKTVPFYKTSLRTGFIYVFKKNHEDDGTEDKYAANISIKYDDGRSLMVMLAGSYVNWDQDINESSEDGILWDLNLRKKIYSGRNLNSDIFFTAHNIFNDSRYIADIRQNPGTWLEGGVRIKF